MQHFQTSKLFITEERNISFHVQGGDVSQGSCDSRLNTREQVQISINKLDCAIQLLIKAYFVSYLVIRIKFKLLCI